MTDTAAPMIELDDVFARTLPEFGVEHEPDSVPTPELVAFNVELAEELGLDAATITAPEGVATLAGNTVPAGAHPIAMAYAGHQFGGFSPQLGDGRAVLLGEIEVNGVLRDVHLKGSGRTPFARGGDGKATVGPMLREYLMASALHAIGIPTAQALAVVTTGEHIRRDGPEPGAVLTRVASSHIRVGTFEYAARMADPDAVRRLADHAIERHYPGIEGTGGDRYLAFFEAVLDVQATLVAKWMLVGFIHGVMNTDNVTISGETIDYGPCAFMDRFEPSTVYSSIDRGGRYAYDRQPAITQWNLARLAESLLAMIDVDADVAVEKATELLRAFPDRYRAEWLAGMRSKLGLVSTESGDGEMFDGLLEVLRENSVDYTSVFRSLAMSLRTGDAAPAGPGEWQAAWRTRLDTEGRDIALVADEMDQINPIYIPRNHLVDQALSAATAGNIGPFETLLDVVTRPFVERPELASFVGPAPKSFDEGFQTFCGT